jgi:hypothetical protein
MAIALSDVRFWGVSGKADIDRGLSQLFIKCLCIER